MQQQQQQQYQQQKYISRHLIQILLQPFFTFKRKIDMLKMNILPSDINFLFCFYLLLLFLLKIK